MELIKVKLQLYSRRWLLSHLLDLSHLTLSSCIDVQTNTKCAIVDDQNVMQNVIVQIEDYIQSAQFNYNGINGSQILQFLDCKQLDMGSHFPIKQAFEI